MNYLWLARLYTAVLVIYPRSFRTEFAEEMQAIFTQAAQEAADQGALALGRLCLNELAGLPAGALRAHGQALKNRAVPDNLPAQSNLLESSWRELLLVLAVFLLPAVLALVNGRPPFPTSLGLPAAGLFLGVMILIGWLGGFPLWSLPYVGLVLAVAAYLHLFQWVAGLVSPALITNFSPGPLDRSTYLLLEIVTHGMLWLMLFCLTLLVVALLAVFNRFQPLLSRLCHDWSLLSYILYGESVFALLVLFESHRSDPNYAIASLLCLLAGVWFYLRSPSRRLRLLALVACLTLAVGVAVLEKGLLAFGGGGFFLGPVSYEDGRLLLSWASMVAALLLPGLLSRSAPRGTRPAAGGLPSG